MRERGRNNRVTRTAAGAVPITPGQINVRKRTKQFQGFVACIDEQGRIASGREGQ